MVGDVLGGDRRDRQVVRAADGRRDLAGGDALLGDGV
jgi:hypothetical protein